MNKEVSSAAAQNEKYGACSLLWWASYGGHKEAVAALLKAGAKKDFKSKHGEDCVAIALHKDRAFALHGTRHARAPACTELTSRALYKKDDDVVVMLGGKVPPKPAPAPAAAKPAAAPAAAAAKPAAGAKPAAAAAPAAAAKPAAAAAKPAAAAPAAAKPAAAAKKP